MRLILVLSGFVLAWSAGAAVPAAVQSGNVLGFRLIEETNKQEKAPANIIVSPLSAHYALSMALNGAAGGTQDQFLAVLGYAKGTSVSGINAQNKTLSAALNKPALTEKEKADLEPLASAPPVVSIQNSAWATNGATDHQPYTFQPAFVKVLSADYGVKQAKSLDFKSEKSADVINKWTSDATHAMIPSIIDAHTLSQLEWVLLNTTYLEGKWSKAFSAPSPAPFTIASGSKVDVPTMTRTAQTRYMSDTEVQMAELPLLNSSLRAYVILPQQPDGFAKLQNSKTGVWSEGFWSGALKQLNSVQGSVTMPNFAFESGVTLLKDQPITQGLGLNFLFQDTANFAKMDGAGSQPSKVGIIKQNSKIEWGQYGIKAAAATLVGGMARSASFPSRPVFDMVVDRPFFFAIYDEATQTFLFLGQVVDPR